MKFTLSWLKDWLDTDADPTTIADTLTNLGLEVEGLSNPAEALAPFRVAKVLTAEKHPQADKLQYESVLKLIEAGKNSTAQMLTGGKRKGDKGYFIELTIFLKPPDDNDVVNKVIFVYDLP